MSSQAEIVSLKENPSVHVSSLAVSFVNTGSRFSSQHWLKGSYNVLSLCSLFNYLSYQFQTMNEVFPQIDLKSEFVLHNQIISS